MSDDPIRLDPADLDVSPVETHPIWERARTRHVGYALDHDDKLRLAMAGALPECAKLLWSDLWDQVKRADDRVAAERERLQSQLQSLRSKVASRDRKIARLETELGRPLDKRYR